MGIFVPSIYNTVTNPIMGGKNAIKERQRTRICMKYHLKAFITVGVLGGDGQSAAVVNVRRRTLSGWSRTTPRTRQSDHWAPHALKMAAASLSTREHDPRGTSRHQGNDALA